ncbi:hypothetical protein QE418_000692 [Microbacterium testaceum]|uniref:hypothetical protein n=1 Tax=Microbacterium TaxID=33882 RepID=UPI00278A74B3|nr:MULTISPECIES: hypothetical protein [Microbacterium]MDQ1111244.1 hypothetical protein [Microbacterium testaceum]MDR6098218.1 hypothetical protein [Microbacterium sp. SORGH_AS_0454]
MASIIAYLSRAPTRAHTRGGTDMGKPLPGHPEAKQHAAVRFKNILKNIYELLIRLFHA